MSNAHINEHQAHSLDVANPDATDSMQGSERFTNAQPETSHKTATAAYASGTAADPARIIRKPARSETRSITKSEHAQQTPW